VTDSSVGLLQPHRRHAPHSNELRAFYQRLRSAGKTPKMALTACMRKLIITLNALIKHRTPWAVPALC
jgi:transposase